MNSDYILPIHLLILAYAGWNILRADHLGFAWVTGKTNLLDPKDIRKYHERVWIGLLGMIITGLLLFWPMRDYLLSRWQFLLKMFFVLALVANGLVIGHVQTIAARKQYKDLSLREKLPLLISGAISTIGWIGAAIAAFFIVQEF